MATQWDEAYVAMDQRIPKEYPEGYDVNHWTRFGAMVEYLMAGGVGVSMLWQASFIPLERLEKMWSQATAPPTDEPRPAVTLEELLHTTWSGYAPEYDPVMLRVEHDHYQPRFFRARTM